jgi:multiple sugar transport system permease protein
MKSTASFAAEDPRAERGRRTSRALVRRRAVPYVLCAPAVLTLIVTVAYPILFNLWIGMTEWNMVESPAPERFVGLDNFAAILADGRFWNSLRVTAAFTVLAVAIEFALGMALALAVSEDIYLGRLLRTLLIAPIMATPLVVGLVFKLLWHSDYGVINHYLGLIGLGPFPWLGQPTTAFIAILVTEVWHNTSFVFLVLLGAMQLLPREPYEAAIVDGADAWRRFVHITLPLLRPAILVALLFRMVFTIRLFDEVWALTQGGPLSATETISILIYKAAFTEFRMGHAAALSILLLVLTAALALGLIRLLYRRAE